MNLESDATERGTYSAPTEWDNIFYGSHEALASLVNLDGEGDFGNLQRVCASGLSVEMGSIPLGLWSYLSGYSPSWMT